MADEQCGDAEAIVRRALHGVDAGGKTWVCERCGETLEGQFEACWKCCTARDAGDVADDSVEEGGIIRGRRGEAKAPPQAFWFLWGLMALAALYLLRSYTRSAW